MSRALIRFGQELLLIPRNTAIAVLWLYRRLISPLYGDVCRYYPTCSHYAVDSVARFGVIEGGAKAVRRISRCHPWAAGGIDDVPPARRTWNHRNAQGFVRPGAQ